MRLTWDMTRRLADEITMRPSEQAALIERYATLLGCHTSTLRRHLSALHGLKLGEERGRKGSYVSDADARLIGKLLVKSIRKDRTNLTVQAAIELAWRNGLLSCDRMPPLATVTRRLRELEIAPADLVAPSPHLTMASEHANHIQQLDASLCIQYRFGKKGLNMRHVDFHKLDKTKKIRDAIHRWVLADHLSGAFVPMYFQSPGERVDDMVHFLYWAWRPKDDPRIPFCGIPRVLYVDRGPAFVSHSLRNLCQAYGIELNWHEPGRARATGSVEVTHWCFERKFESKLRHEELFNLEQLIEHARLESIKICATDPHSRHGKPRYDAWEESVPRPVRVPCESFEQFCWLAFGKTEERTVEPNGCISYASDLYQLVGARPGQKVTLKPHPFEDGRIRVFDGPQGQEIPSRLVSFSDQGAFPDFAVTYGEQRAAMPETAAEKLKKEARELPQIRAYLREEDLPHEIYDRNPVPFVAAREEAEREPEVRLMDAFEVKEWVIARLQRGLTREEGRWWNARVGEGLPAPELEQTFEEFRSAAPEDDVHAAVA